MRVKLIQQIIILRVHLTNVTIVLIINEGCMINYQLNKKNISGLYGIGAIVFIFYGIFVCPFIESLPKKVIFVEVGLTFLAMLLVRFFIFIPNSLLNKASPIVKEIVNFTLFGILLSIFMGVNHEFPIESNLKVIFGMVILGVFTGIISEQLTLIERYQHMSDSPYLNTQLHGERESIIQQFMFLMILLVIALTTTLVMVAVKDLFWLEEQPERFFNGEGKISIIKEFIFISTILFLYTFSIVFLWGKKLSVVLRSKENALNEVSLGSMSTRIPIYNHDEFGVLGSLTNNMLSNLEKNKIELQQTRDSAIVGLSALAESRDNETGAHILRTQKYIKSLALDLQALPSHSSLLSDEYIDLLYKSAPLHDVGKVGIPDNILLKPGKLTDDEFETMKQHPMIGAQALSIAESQMEGDSSFLMLAKEIALTHHEKWDGSGYPQKLEGEDIPLSGRLMALADVYDALISKRVYKPGFSHEKARGIILEGKGTHFDPQIVEAFMRVEDEFKAIAKQYQDK